MNIVERNILKELREENGMEISITTFEEWQDIKAYGTYELDYNHGEIWTCRGKLYLLDIWNLSPEELKILNFMYKK